HYRWRWDRTDSTPQRRGAMPSDGHDQGTPDRTKSPEKRKRGRPPKVQEPGAAYRRHPTVSPRVDKLLVNDPEGFGEQASASAEEDVIATENACRVLIEEIMEFKVRKKITGAACDAAA